MNEVEIELQMSKAYRVNESERKVSEEKVQNYLYILLSCF